jgi:prevent-host-death family protein
MASLPKSISSEARVPLSKVKPSSIRSEKIQESASIAEAKANFSSIINNVERSRAEIIVMRRGTPVAKIVPFDQTVPSTGYGWMRGSVRELGDIVGPTGEEWTAGDE